MLKLFAIIHNACLDHLSKQIISFTGPFSHTCKYRKTAICFRDIVDELLDQYGLTYTRTTKKPDLTTLCIRLNKVNYFNTCI